MIQTAEELVAIIKRGRVDQLRPFFRGMPESERAKFASTAIREYKALMEERARDILMRGSNGRRFLEVTSMAVLATASAEQLAKLDWNGMDIELLDIEFLEELKPHALDSFGEILLNQQVRHIALVRLLIRRGVCQKPDCESYYRGLLSFSFVHDCRRGKIELHESLLQNRDVLEEDLWRLFETEGDGENNFASLEKYSGLVGAWAPALVKLAREGEVSRDRLLAESLKSLSRGFIQFRAGWFSRLHEELEPTIEERRRHCLDYARLLGSPIPPTVSFAIKALEKIDKDSALSEDILTTYFVPTFTAQQKAVAISAVALFDRAAKRNRKFASESSTLVTNALQHESVDVQSKAIEYLKRHYDKSNAELNSKLHSLIETVSPSIQSQLSEMLGHARAPLEISNVDYKFIDKIEGWPFARQSRLRPIDCQETLVQNAAFCLEHPDQVLEIERIIDAVARMPLPVDRNADQKFKSMSAALVQRSSKLAAGKLYRVPSVQILLGDFLCRWLKHPLPFDSALQEPLLHPLLKFMRLKMRKLLSRIERGKYLPLLSTPTHEGGWIENAQLIERLALWNKAGEEPDEYDLSLAFLRTYPGSRSELAETSRNLPKLANALDYVLGTTESLSDKESALGAATRYSREPINTSDQLDMGTGSIYNQEKYGETTEPAVLRWLITSTPSLRECLFHAGVRWSSLCVLNMDARDRNVRAYLEPLTQSGAPLGPLATELLALGLILPDPECVSVARDAVIVAIEEQRLDTQACGTNSAALLRSEKARPKRLAASLREIARVSDLHLDAVLQIIEYSLQGTAGRAPKDLYALLELFTELLIQSGKTLKTKETREYLQALDLGGKSTKLVKQLLQMKR